MGWFSDSVNSAFAAFAVSVIALGVSVWAILTSRQTNCKLLEIEQQREKDRQDKALSANLTAKLEHLQKDGRFALHITNNGASEARNVKVLLNGKPISELKHIEPKDLKKIATLGLESTVSYMWSCGYGNPRAPFDIEITWSDDSMKSGQYSTTLTHPTKPI